MKDVVIFPATLEDIGDLQKIEIECGLSPWTLEGYKAELARSESATFVARENGGQATGFIVGRISTEPGGVAEIFNIGIVPDYQRRGIGKRLLGEFLAVCMKNRVSEVWLEARISNRGAINFYRMNGFEAAGIRKNFYENPTEDAQLMTLKLILRPSLTK